MSAPTPPHNLEAEQAVLGSCLMDRDAIADVAPILTADDFSSGNHRTIYTAILNLYRRRVPADLTTVADELTRAGTLEPIGGHAFLASLFATVPTSVHAGYYAEIVARTAGKRRLIDVGTRLVRMGYDDATDLTADVQVARDELRRVVNDQGAHRGKTFAEALEPFADELEARWDGNFTEQRITTGFLDLDRPLQGGFELGQLITIGARPSIGKTSFMLALAKNAAAYSRATDPNPLWTMIFSSEMTLKGLCWRALAEATGIPQDQLKRGRNTLGEPLPRSVKEHIFDQIAAMADLPIWVDDSSAPTTDQMRERVERFMGDHRVGMVQFDYLERAGNHKGPKDTEEGRISKVARDLKSMAKDLSLVSVALSQLNRGVESRKDKMPILADLRQSGMIEQESDVVLFLYRQDYYESKGMLEPDQINEAKRGTADVIIAKQRDGETGIYALQFVPELTAFRNLRKEDRR